MLSNVRINVTRCTVCMSRVPKLPILDACIYVCMPVCVSRCSMWCQTMRFDFCATAPFDARRVCCQAMRFDVCVARRSKPCEGSEEDSIREPEIADSRLYTKRKSSRPGQFPPPFWTSEHKTPALRRWCGWMLASLLPLLRQCALPKLTPYLQVLKTNAFSRFTSTTII
jgi:hypothetical protein